MADLYGNIPIQPDSEKSVPPAQPELPKKKSEQKEKNVSPPARIKKRYIIIPLLLLTICFGVYSLSSILIPIVIQKKFPQIFYDKTGLGMTVDSAQFNPLNCSLLIQGITLSSIENDGTEKSFLTIGKMDLDLDFTSLLRNGIVAEELLLQGSSLYIKRLPDNTYNISQFFKKYDDPTTEGMDFAELPFLYSLNNISITESEIVFEDTITEKRHTIASLHLNWPTLANFSFNAKTYINPSFSAVINGSPVELTSASDGTSNASSQKTRLTCKLRDLDLPLYINYIPFPLPVEVLNGRAEGTLQIAFLNENQNGLHLLFDYDLQIHNPVIRSLDSAIKVEAPLLNLEGTLAPLARDIAFKNVLLRDPVLTLQKNLSADTLDSLLLKDLSINKSNIPGRLISSVKIGLLIGDNGKVIIETEKENKVYHPVQLSIRNYTNTRGISNISEQENSSFRIQAESKNDLSTFSWQGNFTNGIPEGELEINNLHINQFIKLFTTDGDTDASGNATLRGKLAVNRSATAPFSFNIEQAIVQFNSLDLSEGKKPWLENASVKLTPVTVKSGKIEVGNIHVENGSLTLSKKKLPEVITEFLKNKENSFQGIDYKGNITITSHDNSDTSMQFEKVHLQLKDLHLKKDKGDNFALSAQSVNGGKLNAKGHVSLNPLEGTPETAFNNIPLAYLQFFSAPMIYTPSTSSFIAGSGRYNLSTKIFDGTFEITDGRFANESKKRFVSFSKAIFQNATVGSSFKELSSSQITLKNFSLQTDDFNFIAKEASLKDLSKTSNSITLGILTAPSSEVSLGAGLPKIIKETLYEKNKQFQIDKGLIGGKVKLFSDKLEEKSIDGTFNLVLKDIQEDSIKNDNITLSMTLENHGKVDISGGILTEKQQSKLNFHFEGLDTQLLGNFSPDFKTFPVDAELNGNVLYQLPEQLYTGTVSLKNGSLPSSDGKSAAIWINAEIEDFRYSPIKQNLIINILTLEEPYSKLTQTEELSFFTQAMSSVKTHLNRYGDENRSTTPLHLEIPTMSVHNGKLDLKDQRLSPPYAATISQINGDIHNLHFSTSDKPIDFSFHGLFDQSKMSAEGKVLIRNNSSVLDTLSLNIAQFPLINLQKQLNPLFGVNVEEGKLDASMTYNRDTKAGSISFTIESVKPSPLKPSPGNFTLALLTEKNGAISDQIPVSSSNKPFAQHLIHYFQRLIVKTNVSPYLVLKEPYDAIGEILSINFTEGEASLDNSAKEACAKLGSLLADHPYLKLSLLTIANPVSDRRVLQQQLQERENERVRIENEKLLKLWQEQQRNPEIQLPVDDAIIVKDIPPSELQALTPIVPKKQVVNDAMLIELAQQRLQNTLQYFVDNYTIEKERIELVGAIQLIDELDSPRLEFGLGVFSL